MKDYLSDVTKTLMEQHRVKEAVDFCQRIIDESTSVERKCIAYRDLSEIHFFLTGDGMAAKAANVAGLELLDEHRNLIEHSEIVPPAVMKRVYSDLCEQVRVLSVSFDEYELYARKCVDAGIRGMNKTEKRGLAAIKEMQNRNVPWIEDLYNHVADYAKHNAYGQMAAILTIILENRRTLRLDRRDFNEHVLPGYFGASLNLIAQHVNYCASKGQKPVMDNYAFILDRIAAMLKECEHDRSADPNLIASLLNELEGEREKINRNINASGGQPPKPTAEEIKATFPKELEYSSTVKVKDYTAAETTTEGADAKSPNPMMNLRNFIEIFCFLVITIALWYWALHDGVRWLVVLLAGVVTIVFLLTIQTFLSFRRR